jgi:hypothetical protein
MRRSIVSGAEARETRARAQESGARIVARLALVGILPPSPPRRKRSRGARSFRSALLPTTTRPPRAGSYIAHQARPFLRYSKT